MIDVQMLRPNAAPSVPECENKGRFMNQILEVVHAVRAQRSLIIICKICLITLETSRKIDFVPCYYHLNSGAVSGHLGGYQAKTRTECVDTDDEDALRYHQC